MILINLLPHRQEKRQRRKVAFFVGLGIAAAAGIVAVGIWYLVLQQLITSQQQRNQFLQVEISRLESEIKDIADLKSEIESLKARQKAVEDLQVNRNVPVYLLNELARQTPEGIYFTAIKQADRVVTVTGVSQTNERVSELLRNTAYNSEWLERPELVEIKAATNSGSRQQQSPDQRRLYEFSMRVNLKPTQPDPATSAATSAARAGAAAKP